MNPLLCLVELEWTRQTHAAHDKRQQTVIAADRGGDPASAAPAGCGAADSLSGDVAAVCTTSTMHLLTATARYFLTGAMLPADAVLSPKDTWGGPSHPRPAPPLEPTAKDDIRELSASFYRVLLAAREAVLHAVVSPQSTTCHPYQSRSGPAEPLFSGGIPSYLTWEQRIQRDAQQHAQVIQVAQKQLLSCVDECSAVFQQVYAMVDSAGSWSPLWASYVHMVDDAFHEAICTSCDRILTIMERHLSGAYADRPLFSLYLTLCPVTKQLVCTPVSPEVQPPQPPPGGGIPLRFDLSARVSDLLERHVAQVLAPPQDRLGSMCRLPVEPRPSVELKGDAMRQLVSLYTLTLDVMDPRLVGHLFSRGSDWSLNRGAAESVIQQLLNQCRVHASRISSGVMQYVEDELDSRVRQFTEVQRIMAWVLRGDAGAPRGTPEKSCDPLDQVFRVQEAKWEIQQALFLRQGVPNRHDGNSPPAFGEIVTLDERSLYQQLLAILDMAAAACCRVKEDSAGLRQATRRVSGSSGPGARAVRDSNAKEPAENRPRPSEDLAGDVGTALWDSVETVLHRVTGQDQSPDQQAAAATSPASSAFGSTALHLPPEPHSRGGALNSSCGGSGAEMHRTMPEGKLLRNRLQQLRDRRFAHSKFDSGLNPLEYTRRFLATLPRTGIDPASNSVVTTSEIPGDAVLPLFHVSWASALLNAGTSSVGDPSLAPLCSESDVPSGVYASARRSFSRVLAEAAGPQPPQSSAGELGVAGDEPGVVQGQLAVSSDPSVEVDEAAAINVAAAPPTFGEVYLFLPREPARGVLLEDLDVADDATFRATGNRLRVLRTELAQAEASQLPAEASQQMTANALGAATGSQGVGTRRQRSASVILRTYERTEKDMINLVRRRAEEMRSRCLQLQSQYSFLRAAPEPARLPRPTPAAQSNLPHREVSLPVEEATKEDPATMPLCRIRGILCCNIPFEEDEAFAAVHARYVKAKFDYGAEMLEQRELRRQLQPHRREDALCAAQASNSDAPGGEVCASLAARLLARVHELAEALPQRPAHREVGGGDKAEAVYPATSKLLLTPALSNGLRDHRLPEPAAVSPGESHAPRTAPSLPAAEGENLNPVPTAAHAVCEPEAPEPKSITAPSQAVPRTDRAAPPVALAPSVDQGVSDSAGDPSAASERCPAPPQEHVLPPISASAKSTAPAESQGEAVGVPRGTRSPLHKRMPDVNPVAPPEPTHRGGRVVTETLSNGATGTAEKGPSQAGTEEELPVVHAPAASHEGAEGTAKVSEESCSSAVVGQVVTQQPVRPSSGGVRTIDTHEGTPCAASVPAVTSGGALKDTVEESDEPTVDCGDVTEDNSGSPRPSISYLCPQTRIPPLLSALTSDPGSASAPSSGTGIVRELSGSREVLPQLPRQGTPNLFFLRSPATGFLSHLLGDPEACDPSAPQRPPKGPASGGAAGTGVPSATDLVLPVAATRGSSTARGGVAGSDAATEVRGRGNAETAAARRLSGLFSCAEPKHRIIPGSVPRSRNAFGVQEFVARRRAEKGLPTEPIRRLSGSRLNTKVADTSGLLATVGPMREVDLVRLRSTAEVLESPAQLDHPGGAVPKLHPRGPQSAPLTSLAHPVPPVLCEANAANTTDSVQLAPQHVEAKGRAPGSSSEVNDATADSERRAVGRLTRTSQGSEPRKPPTPLSQSRLPVSANVSEIRKQPTGGDQRREMRTLAQSDRSKRAAHADGPAHTDRESREVSLCDDCAVATPRTDEEVLAEKARTARRRKGDGGGGSGRRGERKTNKQPRNNSPAGALPKPSRGSEGGTAGATKSRSATAATKRTTAKVDVKLRPLCGVPYTLADASGRSDAAREHSAVTAPHTRLQELSGPAVPCFANTSTIAAGLYPAAREILTNKRPPARGEAGYASGTAVYGSMDAASEEMGSLASEYRGACAALGLKPNSGLLRFLPSTCGSTVTHLNLSLNYIGPKGLQPLLHVLQVNGPALRHLSLRDNNLESGEIRALVDVLVAVFGPPASSDGLSTVRGPLPPTAAAQSLRVLDLGGNPISYAGGVALIELLAVLPSLRELRIDGTLMPEKQKSHIQQSLDERQATGTRGSGALPYVHYLSHLVPQNISPEPAATALH